MKPCAPIIAVTKLSFRRQVHKVLNIKMFKESSNKKVDVRCLWIARTSKSNHCIADDCCRGESIHKSLFDIANMK